MSGTIGDGNETPIDRAIRVMQEGAMRLDTAYCVSPPPLDGRFAEARDSLLASAKDLAAFRNQSGMETRTTGGESVVESAATRGSRSWLSYKPMECAPKDREIWVVYHGPNGWYARVVKRDEGRGRIVGEMTDSPQPLGWCDLPELPNENVSPFHLRNAFSVGRVWQAIQGYVILRYRIDAVGFGENDVWRLKVTDLDLNEQHDWPSDAFIAWIMATGAKLVDGATGGHDG